MAHSFLLFDFATNEDAAQQARHRIEGWRQGFRLDKKLQVKFERTDIGAASGENGAAKPAEKPTPASKSSKAAGKTADKTKAKRGAKSESVSESAEKGGDESAGSSKIRLIVRLDFSDHEKLSHQRWLERIPTEEPFKDASPKVIRAGDPQFQATSDLYESLD